MVTGDKGATANHIGLSSGIFSKDMTIFTISENDNISSQLKTVENQML
jgi:magnesium-transporting ATPase (P-type)